MRVVFVRHGQSTGNAGVPCDDLALIELTDLGWSQARQVAEDWQERPALIVTSPYLRTQQTAAPTIERFPDVSVEVWPIEEFTYLQPSRWNGTRSAERMPHLERYWSAADPAYCDGDGAESFASLLARARSALDRLAILPSSSLAYVFSHGQFIQAVRAIVTEPELDDRGKMLRFWRKGEPPAIGNGEMILFEWQDGCWYHRPGGRANFDRLVGSIDADLPWHHKQLWIEKATKLHDAVRRSEGAEQERARQALQDHYRNQAHPETSREEIMRRLRQRH